MMKRFFPPLFAALLLLTSPAFAAPAPDPELAYEGDNAEEVAELRERIVEAEDEDKEPEETSGGAMTETIRRFQRDRGLAVDGVIGPETRAALLQRDDEKASDTDEAKAADAEGEKADTDEAKAPDAESEKAEADEAKALDEESEKAEADEAKAADAESEKVESDEAKAPDAEGEKADTDEAKAPDAEGEKADTDEAKAPDADEAAPSDAEEAEASEPNGEAETDTDGEQTVAANGADRVPRGKPVWVEAVAYSPEGAGMGEYTVLGLPCGRGVIAVDPDFIPLGTRVYIPGYGEAVAADTGASIIGNIIDICFDTYDESAEFGRQEMEIYILEYPQ